MTVCNECVSNVSLFFAFKQKVLNAQSTLSQNDEKPGVQDDADGMVIRVTETSDSLIIEHDDNDHQQIYQVLNLDAEKKDQQVYHIVDDDDPSGPTIATVSSKNKVTQPATTQNATKRKRPAANNVTNNEKFSLQVYECLVCPSVLGDILELNEHVAQHTDIRCKVCQRDFQRYANLKRHFASTHSKPKPFVCDLCGLGFSFSINLQRHADLHYGQKIKT